MRKPIYYLLGIFIAFILGVLIFNFIIMPLLVKSGKAITVPEVSGKEEAEAVKIIKESKLKVSIQARRFDPVIGKGKVIVQDPLPGRQVKEGRVVNLIISKGVEKVALPFILGLELEKAKQILAKYDMEIVAIESTFCDTISEGMIVISNPNPGEEVPKGSKVSVKLSLGKGIVVPDFSGLDIDEALALIKEKGLVVGEIKEIEGSGKPGTIIMQSPASGNIVRTNDSINLVVVKKK